MCARRSRSSTAPISCTRGGCSWRAPPRRSSPTSMFAGFTSGKGLAYKPLTMALSQRLDLRQTQALVMTPQLQQAIKLLQMSNVELTSFIEQEIEQNPLLDRDESDPDSRETAASERESAPEEAVAPAPAETAALGTSEPSIGEDVESWRDAAGREGQGDLDLAGDPEAWSAVNGRSD